MGRKNKASLIARRQGIANQVVFKRLIEAQKTAKRVASINEMDQAQFLTSRLDIGLRQVAIKIGPQCLRLYGVVMAANLYAVRNVTAQGAVAQGVQQRPENSFKKHES